MSAAPALPAELERRFQVLRVLGYGAQGTVFLARELALDRTVILKWAAGFDGEEVAARWEQEARVIQSLRHPGVVSLLDCGRVGDGGYLVYPDEGGRDLWDGEVAALWRSPLKILTLLEQVLEALVEVHAAGIVHRDIKPGNLLALPDGRVQLIDFGVVQDPGGQGVRTRTGIFLGTPSYLPPWADRVAVDPRNDLYALGVSAYELWTGENPFDADSMGECFALHQTLVPPAPPHDGTPPGPGLASFVLRLLEKDLERMPPDAATARRWLGQVAAAPGGAAHEARPTPRVEDRAGRATGLLAVGAMALGVMAFVGSAREPAPRPGGVVLASPVPAAGAELVELRLEAVRRELKAVFADPRQVEALEACRDPAGREALFQAVPSLGPLRQAVALLDTGAPPPDTVRRLDELASDLEAAGWGLLLDHRPALDPPPAPSLEEVLAEDPAPRFPGDPARLDARGARALAWWRRSRQARDRLVDELGRGEYGILDEVVRNGDRFPGLVTAAPRPGRVLRSATMTPRWRQLLEERTRENGRALGRLLVTLTRALETAEDPVWLVSLLGPSWRYGWDLTPPGVFYRPVEETLGPQPEGMAGDLLALELALRLAQGGWFGTVPRAWGRSATEAALAVLARARQDPSAQRARARALRALVQLAADHEEPALRAAVARALAGGRRLHPALELWLLHDLRADLRGWAVVRPWVPAFMAEQIEPALADAAARARGYPEGRAWIGRCAPELAASS